MVSRRMPAGGLALACVLLLGTAGAAVPPGEYTITLPGREACEYRGRAPGRFMFGRRGWPVGPPNCVLWTSRTTCAR